MMRQIKNGAKAPFLVRSLADSLKFTQFLPGTAAPTDL
ncbi:hypothetical protein CES86_0979 [Brucella lupini]|uniref:Uncharacterized protein n=1 Tax=Brucella lupini TaxID=255457 RepID=A0A256GXK7_9HYPH|nr:hypothetical protein CES86_0979 [Brucella lupini]